MTSSISVWPRRNGLKVIHRRNVHLQHVANKRGHDGTAMMTYTGKAPLCQSGIFNFWVFCVTIGSLWAIRFGSAYAAESEGYPFCIIENR